MVYVLVTLALASFPCSLAHTLFLGFEPNAVCCLPFTGFCLFLCPRVPSILTSHPPHQWLGEEQPLWLHSTSTHSALVLCSGSPGFSAQEEGGSMRACEQLEAEGWL